MLLIRQVVQQALATKYLSVEAEALLRQLLRTKYDAEDLKAFFKLQQAAMEGSIRQQSRELIMHKKEVQVPNNSRYFSWSLRLVRFTDNAI